MHSHRAVVLIVCAFLIAACQPSQNAARQTQAAQSAFDTAVAAAAVQAGLQAAPTLAATQGPAPSGPPAAALATWPAWALGGSASSVQTAMEQYMLGGLPDGTPMDAHVVVVRYEYYDNNTAVRMEVGVQRSAETADEAAMTGGINSLMAVFGTAVDPEAAFRQREWVPPGTRSFRIHVFDDHGDERQVLSGNWADLISFGAGTLGSQDFLGRVRIEQLAE